MLLMTLQSKNSTLDVRVQEIMTTKVIRFDQSFNSLHRVYHGLKIHIHFALERTVRNSTRYFISMSYRIRQHLSRGFLTVISGTTVLIRCYDVLPHTQTYL